MEAQDEIDLVSPAPARPAARRVVDAAEHRTHAIELDKMRGPKPVSVSLEGARELTLEVRHGLGGFVQGAVDWGDARLIR